MTVNRGPGVAKNGSVGVTTLEHRLQLAGQYAENAPGVPRSGVLAQATSVLVSAKPNMSYDIGQLAAVISRTAAEGVYTPTLTGTTNVTTDDAPASNSRWDLIYVKQNDVAKGDADNLAVVGVVRGTAAASPSKPTGALPAGALVLAEARIFAGTTATNGGSNTVSQVWRHTASRGASITIRNATERAEITAPASGQVIDRLDTGLSERWNGTRWAQAALTQIGKGSLGAVTTLAGTPSWTDIATVTANSLGGEVTIDFNTTLINANSGDDRTAAVRVICDGAEVDSYAFFMLYKASANVPAFPAQKFFHTPTAGSHTWKLQGNANIGAAVQATKGSMIVLEKP